MRGPGGAADGGLGGLLLTRHNWCRGGWDQAATRAFGGSARSMYPPNCSKAAAGLVAPRREANNKQAKWWGNKRPPPPRTRYSSTPHPHPHPQADVWGGGWRRGAVAKPSRARAHHVPSWACRQPPRHALSTAVPCAHASPPRPPLFLSFIVFIYSTACLASCPALPTWRARCPALVLPARLPRRPSTRT